MKTKNPILVALLLITFNVSAQFVTIPDANFVTWLQNKYPTCMSGNQMDTTCNDIVSETSIVCYGQSISDFTGISYFDNLLKLNIGGNLISSIPVMPNTVTNFSCTNSASLTSLSNLPPSLTILDCSNNTLPNLPNLPSGLERLKCSDIPGLTSLPNLPSGLEILSCYDSDLGSLPVLPNTLERLDCSQNNISALPVLPNSLEQLDITLNPITSAIILPTGLKKYTGNLITTTGLPVLPLSLEKLEAHGCNLSSIPNLSNYINLDFIYLSNNPLGTLPNLPSDLSSLRCEFCMLTALPALPPTMSTIEINDNILTILPTLPTSLYKFEANNNNISTLPLLPAYMSVLKVENNVLTTITNLPTNMDLGGLGIHLDNNLLTHIPNLPDVAGFVSIENNMLAELPPIGDISYLRLENNNLTCLPVLPSVITDLDLDGNPINCIPNYINAMNNDPWLSTLPLCEFGDIANNPSGCATAQGIEGYLIHDTDTSCTVSLGDFGAQNITILNYDNSNLLLGTTSTSYIGRYFFLADSGSYLVEVDTTDKPFEVNCIHPGADSTFTIGTVDSLIKDVDFFIQCKPGFDIGTQSVVPLGYVFPGQNHTLRIKTGDMSAWYGLNCAGGISGSVTVSVTGPVTYINHPGNSLVPAISGTNYTYTVSDFGLIDMDFDFALIFETDTTAIAGDTICVNVSVTPTTGDFNASNNNFDFCYEVLNSYDPNIKTVYPSSVLPNYDDWLTYTIHFQNTGNAPAFNIRLEDTISSYLDKSTFEVIGYSHPNSFHLNNDKLVVYYPNIMLPDSTTNEPESKGYIQYRIKPIENLPLGTTIENTAHIFFDYNAPIITNTISTTYEVNDLSASYNLKADLKMNVYPNPNTGSFFIQYDSDLTNVSIKLYDIFGREVPFISSILTTGFELKLSDDFKGLVIVVLKSNQGIAQSKIIIE